MAYFTGLSIQLLKNNTMIYREAQIADNPQIMQVRHSVKENILADRNSITGKDCHLYLTQRGKGWVCEIDKIIVGFAIVDLIDNNIWALFVHPEFERRGIGKKLHERMLHWYFAQGKVSAWLGTEPNTRAAQFYKKAGWEMVGRHGENEIKLQMTAIKWRQQNMR